VTGLRVRRRVARFVLDAAARVRVRVARRAGGRWVPTGSVRRAAKAGANRVALGRLMARAGNYRVSVAPAGGRAVIVRVSIG
jgi:hypothetical protein